MTFFDKEYVLDRALDSKLENLAPRQVHLLFDHISTFVADLGQRKPQHNIYPVSKSVESLMTRMNSEWLYVASSVMK